MSRICANLDEEVAAFRDRLLAGTTYPCVFLDATYCKARVGRRVLSQAVVVVAIEVAADWRREVLGFGVGETESQPFWTTFLRSLKARGLGGVKLVISDEHTGLIAAIGTVFAGACWQRCRVHFMRNVLLNVPKTTGPMVVSIIRTIFAQPGTEHVFAQFHELVRVLTRSHPRITDMLEQAKDDILALCGSPQQHWQQIWSTNPLERVNKEIKRRTDIVGTFPNPATLPRLAGHVLIEQHDEWDGANRRYSSEHPMKLLNATKKEATIPELAAA